jgi:hypothetical protein
MHCSALAADALSEAIYEYMTKEGRAIPAALRERHEHIQKDMATLEERYKVFLDRGASKAENDDSQPPVEPSCS